MEPQHERRTKDKHGGFTGWSPQVRTAHAQTVEARISHPAQKISDNCTKTEGFFFSFLNDHVWERVHRLGPGESLGFIVPRLLYAGRYGLFIPQLQRGAGTKPPKYQGWSRGSALNLQSRRARLSPDVEGTPDLPTDRTPALQHTD